MNGLAQSRRRRVSILGATGSIGKSTFDLIERDLQSYQVEVLTAGRNVELLADQARRLNAACAVIGDETAYRELKHSLAGTGTEVAAGREALVAAAGRPVDWVMAGIVGAAGLEPTLEAVRTGAIVALANKECLVCAGDILLEEAARHKATILPADSEHNAIFQALDTAGRDRVRKIVLTASGGPFRTTGLEEMRRATPEAAVKHPNWNMGAKISVDSATMMNKGLELIEACYLFSLPESRIDVLVHPQSIIHGLVAYVDGSFLAQLGEPDMRIPISYTLGWPDRIATPCKELSLEEIGRLDFEPPDMDRFPALRLAREVLQGGGSAPIVFNAANEEAVAAFLARKIGFLDIAETVERTLDGMDYSPAARIEDVGAIDEAARATARDLMPALD